MLGIYNKTDLSEPNAVLCSKHEVNEHSVEVMSVFSQVSFLKLFSVNDVNFSGGVVGLNAGCKVTVSCGS